MLLTAGSPARMPTDNLTVGRPGPYNSGTADANNPEATMTRRFMIACVLMCAMTAEAAAQAGYRKPPEPIRQILDIPPTPNISVSPTGDQME